MKRSLTTNTHFSIILVRQKMTTSSPLFTVNSHIVQCRQPASSWVVDIPITRTWNTEDKSKFAVHFSHSTLPSRPVTTKGLHVAFFGGKKYKAHYDRRALVISNSWPNQRSPWISVRRDRMVSEPITKTRFPTYTMFTRSSNPELLHRNQWPKSSKRRKPSVRKIHVLQPIKWPERTATQ